MQSFYGNAAIVAFRNFPFHQCAAHAKGSFSLGQINDCPVRTGSILLQIIDLQFVFSLRGIQRHRISLVHVFFLLSGDQRFKLVRHFFIRTHYRRSVYGSLPYRHIYFCHRSASVADYLAVGLINFPVLFNLPFQAFQLHPGNLQSAVRPIRRIRVFQIPVRIAQTVRIAGQRIFFSISGALHILLQSLLFVFPGFLCAVLPGKIRLLFRIGLIILIIALGSRQPVFRLL